MDVQDFVVRGRYDVWLLRIVRGVSLFSYFDIFILKILWRNLIFLSGHSTIHVALGGAVVSLHDILNVR